MSRIQRIERIKRATFPVPPGITAGVEQNSPPAVSFKAALWPRRHRKTPNLGSDARIPGRQHIGVSEFDIRRLDAGPFCGGAEKPAPLASYARGVECVADEVTRLCRSIQ